MQLNITARHLDLTPALTDYVHRKVEKAQRYFDSIIWAQTVLTIEKHRHSAEIVVHTPGSTFRTLGESGDLYSAIDLAAHKLDMHLSRVKDKRKSHRGTRNGNSKSIRFKPSVDPDEAAEHVPGRSVSEVTKVALERRSLSNAIRELNARHAPFLLFINERTNQVSAVYKKGKDDYGLVEAVIY